MIIEYPLFVTDDERQELIDFVESRVDKYTHISNYNSYKDATDVPLFFYGSPVYPADTQLEYITPRPKSLDLVDLFLLEKCMKKLEDEFKRPSRHLEGTSYPGFHIFENRDGYSDKFAIDRYHVDSDVFKYRGGDDPVYSFVVVIDTTNVGDTLDYVVNENDLQHNYIKNSMYVWPGSMPHKIGDVDLSMGGKRITYQGHFIKTETELLYYW